MNNKEILTKFEALLAEALSVGNFVKLSLGNYNGSEAGLKNIYVKPVVIKRQPHLSFNYRYQTRDIFKNYAVEEGLKLIISLLQQDFRIVTLFLTTDEIIVERNKKGNYVMRERKLEQQLLPELTHDKEKKRLIRPSANHYLHALKIADAEGNVYKNAQDKYKQINHYISILSTLIKELPEGRIQNVVDMGSGKGYLTFALYDYLHQQLKLHAKVTGVEFREDLVSLCNNIAKDSGFDQLKFVEGSIQDYDVSAIDLLIALHACDTATDDAIFKGIEAGAALIVVAPCCHKQIRRELEKHKVKNELSFLTKYGIFLERQAEMVTDGIRALILEYFGYRTKVFEFISDAHTPKNVLVVGVKAKEQGARNKEEILQKIKDTKAYFGIGHHHLEKLFGL